MPVRTALRALVSGVVLLIGIITAVVVATGVVLFRSLDADLFDVVED